MDSPSGSIEKKELPPGISVGVEDADAEFGGYEERRKLERKLERKLIWKLDCRLSILVVIFILNFIDRNNAAAARLRGFESDLNLKGQEFNTLLSILYVGYTLMQVPSNMFLNYIGRPSLYIPACMMIWGTISILTGITKTFVGALLTRFFLGFVEAAFLPGSLFLLSKWYRREELGLRICILFCGNIISNAFGSLLASGILNDMQGKLDQAAWRWLFFIEGSLTIVIAFAAMFILPDFPTTTRWITPLERSLAMRRMAEDGGINVGDQEELESHSEKVVTGFGINAETSHIKWTGILSHHGHGLWLAISDPKVWHSDKQGERFYHIACALSAGILGFIISISTMNVAARYVSLCLMSLSYCGTIIMFAWIINTFPRPPSKRAVALALSNCIAQLGSIAGSYVWPTNWGPSYKNSYAICIAMQGLVIVMFWMLRKHLKALNDRLEKAEEVRGERQKGFRSVFTKTIKLGPWEDMDEHFRDLTVRTVLHGYYGS
ncbi:hypothetical protein EW145_g5920 [Phellinidium pouzarii]|uniref:Major facilitator superfamily (MFS) profile domain-containing protein n=1 Tax=Phellinidium pouzarii TaxID=167371 RepID=A0A4S4KYB2_9AGAM|nr:hypothetical protein EW145_g5920 [Phellinidium pouzarii]